MEYKLIENKMFSFYMDRDDTSSNSHLVVGGYDESKFDSKLNWYLNWLLLCRHNVT